MTQEPGPSIGEFLRGELRRMADEVCVSEAAVRSEEHDVHAMRVACRRLRTILAASGRVVVDPRARHLRDELRWLASELGRSRELEVLGDRIDEALGAEAVSLGIRAQLDRAAEEGRRTAIAALDSPRWPLLKEALAEVDCLELDPERAQAPVGVGLAQIVDRQTKRLRAARRRARRAGPDLHDEALHEVRKRAKAVRYSAEVATPILGERAERLAELAEQVQDVLGQHQDTVVARERLHRLVTESGLGADAAFALGAVAAEEEQRGEEARREFEHLPKPPKHVAPKP